MEEKIRKLLERLKEIEAQLSTGDSFADQNLYRKLTQEHAYLAELQEAWEYFQKTSKQLIENRALLLDEKDPELIAIIKEDLQNLEREEIGARLNLERLLVPPDPRDSHNIILELRAGTGGEEAALFVADCIRMYQCYANQKGWQFETLSCSSSEKGGFKEYIMSLSGHNVFRLLQYEAGVHRVQRVPETEAQGRIHTSAITVAVLLEPSEDEKIEIDEKDLKIETYRASGAGGQHVNTTDSAVRITHLPTKTVVYCQEERSQHKNKEKAMRLLSARIAEEQARKQHKEQADLRSLQIGSGDRSERIRTYNFPQNRITDHRIDLTLYKLDRVMNGDLDEITNALVAYFYQQKLTR